ncbi:MAG: MarR family winged helix-turn-helix transcriptional regulator [Acidimicrobiia bacterium]
MDEPGAPLDVRVVDAAWARGGLPDEWRAVLPPGADPASLLIALWLNRLGRLFEVGFEALVREHGLIPSESRVLGTLLLNGSPYELSPTRLNEIVVLTSGGMTKAVSRLETLGLVDRRADPADGRGVLVRLTRAGRRAGTAVLAGLVTSFDAQLAPIGVDAKAAIVDALRALLGTYGANHRAAAADRGAPEGPH